MIFTISKNHRYARDISNPSVSFNTIRKYVRNVYLIIWKCIQLYFNYIHIFFFWGGFFDSKRIGPQMNFVKYVYKKTTSSSYGIFLLQLRCCFETRDFVQPSTMNFKIEQPVSVVFVVIESYINPLPLVTQGLSSDIDKQSTLLKQMQ